MKHPPNLSWASLKDPKTMRTYNAKPAEALAARKWWVLDAEGQPVNFEFSPRFDGKDYRVTGLPEQRGQKRATPPR